MTELIRVTNTTDFNLNLDVLNRLTTDIIISEGYTNLPLINLLICCDEEMKHYNFRYRGLNEPTDVLSFPLFIPHEIQDEIGGNIELGDIIIDINVVSEQKGQNNIEEELKRVYIHGLLHLIGYDHINKADRLKMQDREEKYFAKWYGLI